MVVVGLEVRPSCMYSNTLRCWHGNDLSRGCRTDEVLLERHWAATEGADDVETGGEVPGWQKRSATAHSGDPAESTSG